MIANKPKAKLEASATALAEAAAETVEAGRDDPSGAGAAPEMEKVRPQIEEPGEPDAGDVAYQNDGSGADDILFGLIVFDTFTTSDAFAVAAVGLLLPYRDRSHDDEGAPDGLGDIDRIIDHEVHEMEGLIEAMRASIIARFAGYMIAARNTLPRGEIMGAIAALKAQRNAELAEAKAAAAKALNKRIKDILEARRAMRSNRKKPPEGPGR